MAASLSSLSASVTRILSLTGFAKELKTKDIQQAFSEWESANGGFKIKWRDDTSLLIVFQDATVAKRAYLQTVAFPPAILATPDGSNAVIKPYDGPDAQAVIQNVNSRGQGHSSNPSRHGMRSSSVSAFSNGGHGRERSTTAGNTRSGPLHVQVSGSTTSSLPEHSNGNGFTSIGREPSPTLPSLPSHPTLNALISSSLGERVTDDLSVGPVTSVDSPSVGAPRIGDPGKRMLGAALGMRHPGLGPRILGGSSGPDQGLQRAMGALTVSE